MNNGKAKKNRGWVKNAALIFLALMLVLTLFSNTILNRSLPEVATSYTSSGSITQKIRGEGTVTANETYELKIGQTREIKSVAMKVGDIIEEGDIIIHLADAESEELATVAEEMEQLNYDYQKTLIEASNSDFAKENRDIRVAREELEEATKKKAEAKVTNEEFIEAKAKVTAVEAEIRSLAEEKRSIERAVADAKKRVEEIEAELEAAGGGGGPDSAAVKKLEREIDQLKTEIGNLEDEISDIERTFRDEFENIKSGGSEMAYKEVWDKDYAGKDLSLACNHDADGDTKCSTNRQHYNKLSEDPDAQYDFIHDWYFRSDIENTLSSSNWRDKINTVYAEYYAKANPSAPGASEFLKISENEKTLEEKRINLGYLREDLRDAQIGGETPEVVAIKTRLTQAENALRVQEDRLETNKYTSEDKDAALEDRKEELKELEDNREKYDLAVVDEKTAQKSLEDLLFALAESQKEAGQKSALTSLDLKKKQSDMTSKQEELDELRGNAVGASVISPVRGVVKKIGASAGNVAAAEDIVAEIEVVDRGYHLKMNVTTEQSQKVKPGDKAEVSNRYWGSEITAVLQGIQSDPDSPGQGKQLVFNLSGDELESGSTLNISVGQKSQNYEVIVPNSAIKEDNNGFYVFTVTSKSSSLINRMIATKVPVTKLASDDTNTAIEGGITAYDYVITTSDRPIEPGMQVRIANS